MSSESILLAFQSAFPTLYAVPEAGSEESSSATGDATHAEVPAPVAEPSADGSERQQQGASARPSLGAGDPYSNKVERITGKVGCPTAAHACMCQGACWSACIGMGLGNAMQLCHGTVVMPKEAASHGHHHAGLRTGHCMVAMHGYIMP